MGFFVLFALYSPKSVRENGNMKQKTVLSQRQMHPTQNAVFPKKQTEQQWRTERKRSESNSHRCCRDQFRPPSLPFSHFYQSSAAKKATLPLFLPSLSHFAVDIGVLGSHATSSMHKHSKRCLLDIRQKKNKRRVIDDEEINAIKGKREKKVKRGQN